MQDKLAQQKLFCIQLKSRLAGYDMIRYIYVRSKADKMASLV